MVALLDVIRAICSRPQLSTPSGSFCEVVAFISGYAAGLDPSKRYLDGELCRFSLWMAERFNLVPRNWLWWNVLLFGCDDDQQRALRDLPELYAEFVGESSGQGRTSRST
jgi:hypothetical protein